MGNKTQLVNIVTHKLQLGKLMDNASHFVLSGNIDSTTNKQENPTTDALFVHKTNKEQITLIIQTSAKK